MSYSARTPVVLLPALALVAVVALTACGGEAPAPAATPSDTGVVHLPTTAAPTTDSAGHAIKPLPAPVTQVAMSDERVRGFDYSYVEPVGWSRAERELDPPPDSLLAPDDEDVPAFIAVERPIKVGSHSLAEVVDGLREGFVSKGLAPMAAPEREVAGYRAMGIVVDQAQDVRDVYYVVAYTEKVFAVRLTYDPAQPESLDVYRAVLDSWSWG